MLSRNTREERDRELENIGRRIDEWSSSELDNYAIRYFDSEKKNRKKKRREKEEHHEKDQTSRHQRGRPLPTPPVLGSDLCTGTLTETDISVVKTFPAVIRAGEDILVERLKFSEEKMSAAEQKATALAIDCESYKIKNKNLQDKLTRAVNQITTISSESEIKEQSLNTKLEQLSLQHCEISKQSAKWKSKHNKVVVENESLKQELVRISATKDKESIELKNNNRLHAARSISLKNEVDSLRSQLNSAESNISTKTMELTQSNETVKQLNNQISHNLDPLIEKLQREKTDVIAQSHSIKLTQAESVKNQASSANIISSLKAANERLKNDVKRKEEETQTAFSQLSKCKAKANDAIQAAAEAEIQVDELRRHLELRKKDITKLRVQESTSRVENMSIQSSLADVDKQVSDAQIQLSTHEQTIKKLRSELADAQETIDNSERTTKRLRSQLLRSTDDNKSMESQIQSMERSVQNSRTETDRLTKQLGQTTSGWEDTRIKMQTKIQELEGLAASSETEKQKGQLEVDSANIKLQAMKESNTRLHQQLDDASETISKLKEEDELKSLAADKKLQQTLKLLNDKNQQHYDNKVITQVENNLTGTALYPSGAFTQAITTATTIPAVEREEVRHSDPSPSSPNVSDIEGGGGNHFDQETGSSSSNFDVDEDDEEEEDESASYASRKIIDSLIKQTTLQYGASTENLRDIQAQIAATNKSMSINTDKGIKDIKRALSTNPPRVRKRVGGSRKQEMLDMLKK